MQRILSVDAVGCLVDRGQGGIMERAVFRGFTYTANLFKNKSDYFSWCLNPGSVKPISHSVSSNLITAQGKNLDNDVMFGATAKIATWYVLLFNTNTTILSTHTYHTPGFTEDVDYDEADRPIYVDVPSVAGVMTNVASRAVFTITTGGQTIYGAGLVGGTNGTVKGDHTDAAGYLYSASLFGTPHSVLATNVLSVDISITRT